MVNMKKIGAIATGALFLGSTFGMAAAVTFSPTMLVKDNAAAAKLVTSSQNPDASGNAADAASASKVNDAVKAKYQATSGGASVQFKYDSQDIDDSSTSKAKNTSTSGDDFDKADYTALSNAVDKWMEGTRNWTSWKLDLTSTGTGDNTKVADDTGGDKGGIRFDATGDGDVSDGDDQAIYNDLKLEDVTTRDVTITPAMRVGNASAMAANHTVFKLKGQKYVTKKYESSKSQVTLVGVSQMKIANADTTQDMMDAAVLIPGTDIKIGVKGLISFNSTNKTTFGIIEGGVVKEYIVRENGTTSQTADYQLFKGGDDLELLSDFYVFVTSVNAVGSNKYVEVAIGKKTDEFKISDGDTNVLGYAKAKVEQTGAKYNELRFEDSSITVDRDSSVQIANSNVYASYNDDKEFDLIAKNTKTATSGSKLKYSQSPWSDFLGTLDVTVTATGGTTQAVSLSTVKDTDLTSADKSGYNLALFGGPKANAATADLVTQGKSTTDWENSAGEIEVVENAFATGKYAIIAAGENRAATAAAADSLAAMV